MNEPKVGIGVFVVKNGKFLMGQRRNAHGDGTWTVPGGHLEFGESWEDTARREVKEEADIEISDVTFGAITNDVFEEEKKHYATIWMLSEYASGTPTIQEPDKFIALEWRTLDDLPSPLFLPWNQLLESQFFTDIRSYLEKGLS